MCSENKTGETPGLFPLILNKLKYAFSLIGLLSLTSFKKHVFRNVTKLFLLSQL